MLGCKGLILDIWEWCIPWSLYGRWGSTGTVCRTTKNCFQGYDGVGIFLGKMLLTVDLLASFLWGHFASNFAQVRRDYSQYGAIHSSNMAFDVGRLNFRLFWNWVLNIWKEPLIVIWCYKINSSEWKKVDEWVSQTQFTVHGFNTSGAKIIQKKERHLYISYGNIAQDSTDVSN